MLFQDIVLLGNAVPGQYFLGEMLFRDSIFSGSTVLRKYWLRQYFLGNTVPRRYFVWGVLVSVGFFFGGKYCSVTVFSLENIVLRQFPADICLSSACRLPIFRKSFAEIKFNFNLLYILTIDVLWFVLTAAMTTKKRFKIIKIKISSGN